MNLFLLLAFAGTVLFYRDAFWLVLWSAFLANVVYECIVAIFIRQIGTLVYIALLVLFNLSWTQVTSHYQTLLFANGSRIRESDLKDMITVVEEGSLAKDFMGKAEYVAYKKQLLDMRSPRKQDLLKLLDIIKKTDTSGQMRYMYLQKIADQERQDQKINDMHEKGKPFLTSLNMLKTKKRTVPCIRIYQFSEGLAEELSAYISKYSDHPYLILDLRKNPGGSQEVLIETADAFLPADHEILTTMDARHRTTWYTRDAAAYEGEIIVVVDENTASCAEILPLALKKARPDKVHLLGNRTAGKGVGQRLYSFPDSGVRLGVVEFSWTVQAGGVEDLQKLLEADSGGRQFLKGADYAAGIDEYVK